MIRPIKEIVEKKKHDVAIFLGSGPSIHNISIDQWRQFNDYDTWTVNNFIYHWYTDIDFYHVEVKPYNKDIWKQRKLEHGDRYQYTNFIINKNPKRKNILVDIIGKYGNIYEYNMHKINTKKEAIVPVYKTPKDLNTLVCNLNSSVTMILELFYRFKYKKVIFFGVDMNNSEYFWSNGQYGKTHCLFNKDHEKGKQASDPHSTSHIKNFILWFSKEKMKEVGGQFYVGHKDTALYPGLEFFDVLRR